MEKRLGRLEVLYQAAPETVEPASWSIQWALQYSGLADPADRAAGIRTTHDLDDASISQAVAAALVRCGIPRAGARRLVELGLEQLLTVAATSEAAA
jgi:hypothetical protein